MTECSLLGKYIIVIFGAKTLCPVHCTARLPVPVITMLSSSFVGSVTSSSVFLWQQRSHVLHVHFVSGFTLSGSSSVRVLDGKRPMAERFLIDNVSTGILGNKTENWTFLKVLDQGCSWRFLEGRSPAEFSSNPNETHLIQLIKSFRLI